MVADIIAYFLLATLRAGLSDATDDGCRYVHHSGATMQKTVLSDERMPGNAWKSLSQAANACNEISSCDGIVQDEAGTYSLAEGFPSPSQPEDRLWVKECHATCAYRKIVNEQTSITYFDRICSETDSSADQPTNLLEIWSAWTRCTQSCDGGTQTRRRYCSTWNCSGTEELQECNSGVPCLRKIEQIYGVLGPEGIASIGKTNVYTTCVHTELKDRVPCGNQYTVTQKQCDQYRCCYQKPQSDSAGPVCFDSKTYIGSSGRLGWAVWSAWSLCSVTCRTGNRARRRVCTGDIAGSRLCPGNDVETEICSYGACPCDTNPCSNGGTCVEKDDVAIGYICRCQRGFAGRNCDYEEPVLTCRDDSIGVSFNEGIVTDDGLIAESELIRFAETDSSDCFAQKMGSMFYLSLPPPIDKSCGSKMKEDDRKLVIRNKVLWRLSGDSVDATVVLVDISCVYYKNVNSTLDLGFGISPTIRTISTKISKGSFDVRMHIFRDDSFLPSRQYQDDFSVAQGEILYLSVDLKPMKFSNFNSSVVFMKDCFVIDVDKNEESRHDLISDGCPTNPVFTTVLSNGDSKRGKWAIRVFDWKNDDQTNEVYIQCWVKVCSKECRPRCEETQNTVGLNAPKERITRSTPEEDSRLYTNQLLVQRKIRLS